MSDAEELLFDIFIVLSAKAVHDGIILNYERLMRKINTFKTEAEGFEIKSNEHDQPKFPVNPNLFTKKNFR